jgi:hypothetical protein
MVALVREARVLVGMAITLRGREQPASSTTLANGSFGWGETIITCKCI